MDEFVLPSRRTKRKRNQGGVSAEKWRGGGNIAATPLGGDRVGESCVRKESKNGKITFRRSEG